MGNVVGRTEKKAVNNNTSDENTSEEGYFVGDKIRCPNNHQCRECIENRKNNTMQVLEKYQLACNACSKPLNETEGSFWSCLMCNFDLCSNCINKIREEHNTSLEPIEFVDLAGVRIRLCFEDNQVIQYRNESRGIASGFIVETGGMFRGPQYRDYQGTGKISKQVDVINLKERIMKMFKIAKYRKPEFAKSTFVHNPNWKFMQPTTLQQIIMSDKDFECPRPVADVIASFVVERKISIPIHEYEIDVQSEEDHWRSRMVHYGMRSDFTVKKYNLSIAAQMPLSIIHGMLEEELYDRETFLVDINDPEFLMSSGLSDIISLGGSHEDCYLKQLPNDVSKNFAQIGDVFAWDNVVLVVKRKEKVVERIYDLQADDRDACV